MKASVQSTRPNGDAPTAEFVGEGAQLRLYLIYRVALGVALLLAYFGMRQGPLGTFQPALFSISVHLYLVLAIVALLMHLRGAGAEDKQAQTAIFIDIILITVMMPYPSPWAAWAWSAALRCCSRRSRRSPC